MKIILILILLMSLMPQTSRGELMRSTVFRAQLAQIEGANTAANTFRHKYKCLPGDCPHITDFFLPTQYPQLCNGNGNGLLEAQPEGAEGCNETAQFWAQLQAAELIPGQECLRANEDGACTVIRARMEHEHIPFYIRWFGDKRFAEPLGLAVYGDDSHNFYQLARFSEDGAHVLPGLTAQEAFGLDSKIDDGRAGMGTVVARGAQEAGSAYNALLTKADAGFDAGNEAACILHAAEGDVLTDVEQRSAEYALMNENLACSLRIRMWSPKH